VFPPIYLILCQFVLIIVTNWSQEPPLPSTVCLGRLNHSTGLSKAKSQRLSTCLEGFGVEIPFFDPGNKKEFGGGLRNRAECQAGTTKLPLKSAVRDRVPTSNL